MSIYKRRAARPDLDRQAVRYFVYMLTDAAGKPVYIGRSCNVRARLQAHWSNLNHKYISEADRPTWLLDARNVSMVGPFTWDAAVREERRQIETHRPRGNRSLNPDYKGAAS